MKLTLITYIFFSLHILNLCAHETIKGKVVNLNGDPVRFATVILPDGKGTECDSVGYFSFNLNFELPVLLKASAVDYTEKTIRVESTEKELIVYLEKKNYALTDVVVTTNKSSIKYNSTVAAFEINNKEIEKTMPLHVGEVLETKAGFTIRSGYSSPLNLRGMSAKRMLILKNGIRQFSTYNSGFMPHTINTYNLEKVEVEKGASTVKYGAGAMAGTINFVDKTPFTSGGFKGNFISGVAANNGENNFIFNGGWSSDKFATKLTVKQRQANNFHYSDGSEAVNSFYNDKDYALATAYNISSDQTLSFNASMYDGGPWGKPKGFNGSNYMLLNCNNELDNNFSVTYVFTGYNAVQHLNVSLFYANENREMEKKYFTAAGNILSFKETSFFKSYSYGTKASAQFDVAKNVNLSSGIEMYSMHISTPIKATDYLQVFEYENRVSTDARLYNYGLYSEADFIFLDNLILTTGVRYDIAKNFEGEVYNLDQTEERSSLTDAYSATAAFKYIYSQSSLFKINLSKSIRIPDPSELFVDSYTMNGIIYANPDLEPENSQSFDITYNFNNTFFDIEVTSYLWLIKNLINKKEIRRSVGTNYIYKNIGKSRLWGFEATTSFYTNKLFSLNDKFRISASFTYTNGTDVSNSNDYLSEGIPLDYIPPLNIKSQVVYNNKFSNYSFDITLQNIFYTMQERLPVGGYSTPSYNLTNIFAGVEIQNLTFNPTIRLAVNNLFNIEYYSFKSYLPSMGRDLRLFLTLNLSNS